MTSSALANLQLKQEQELYWCLPALYTHHQPKLTKLFLSFSEHVRTLFDTQESESEFYAAMRIKTHLENTLYLSSLQTDLSCAAKLVIAESPACSNYHLTLEYN